MAPPSTLGRAGGGDRGAFPTVPFSFTHPSPAQVSGLLSTDRASVIAWI